MTFYRVREPIGTMMQAKHFKPFETLEEAMAETDIPDGTIAYIYEFDEPPFEHMQIHGEVSARAVWSKRTGWVTIDHPLWGTDIWTDPSDEA